jgi:hypothetical protein
MSREVQSALLVTQYLRATLPEDTAMIRDEGMFLFYCGRFQVRGRVLRPRLRCRVLDI